MDLFDNRLRNAAAEYQNGLADVDMAQFNKPTQSVENVVATNIFRINEDVIAGHQSAFMDSVRRMMGR